MIYSLAYIDKKSNRLINRTYKVISFLFYGAQHITGFIDLTFAE